VLWPCYRTVQALRTDAQEGPALNNAKGREVLGEWYVLGGLRRGLGGCVGQRCGGVVGGR
jgi:hypothetical protein